MDKHYKISTAWLDISVLLKYSLMVCHLECPVLLSSKQNFKFEHCKKRYQCIQTSHFFPVHNCETSENKSQEANVSQKGYTHTQTHTHTHTNRHLQKITSYHIISTKSARLMNKDRSGYSGKQKVTLWVQSPATAAQTDHSSTW